MSTSVELVIEFRYCFEQLFMLTGPGAAPCVVSQNARQAISLHRLRSQPQATGTREWSFGLSANRGRLGPFLAATIFMTALAFGRARLSAFWSLFCMPRDNPHQQDTEKYSCRPLVMFQHPKPEEVLQYNKKG